MDGDKRDLQLLNKAICFACEGLSRLLSDSDKNDTNMFQDTWIETGYWFKLQGI